MSIANFSVRDFFSFLPVCLICISGLYLLEKSKWETFKANNSSNLIPVSRSRKHTTYVLGSLLAVAKSLVHSSSNKISGNGEEIRVLVMLCMGFAFSVMTAWRMSQLQ